MNRLLIIVLATTLLAGCERDEEESIYQPGGAYQQRLDAKGRRHVVRNAEGAALAKIRVRKGTVKVYSAQMLPLGVIKTHDGIEVVRQGEDGQTFRDVSKGVVELPHRLRLEAVEHGWAVFDPAAQRLGYFEWHDDGRLALRDDYSSPPRLFALPDGHEARSPSGEIHLSVTPAYSAPTLLPFALEGAIDELDRVALGFWLQAHRPEPAPK